MIHSDCDCVTCLYAGGPCSTPAKGTLESYYCTKCSFYDKLDKDYMDYVKKDMTRRLEETSDKSQPNTDDDDNDDLDDELTDEMLENHCYHLSWAVFKHLPCNLFLLTVLVLVFIHSAPITCKPQHIANIRFIRFSLCLD